MTGTSSFATMRLTSVCTPLMPIRERDHDARFLELHGARCLRLVDLNTGLVNERRRHDEEDEQNEDAVEHGRKVNAWFA